MISWGKNWRFRSVSSFLFLSFSFLAYIFFFYLFFQDYHENQRTTVEEKAEKLETIGYEKYLEGMKK